MNPGRASLKGAWRLPAAWPAPVRWAALLALSALISLVWGLAGLPAALLLGPMIGGIIFGVNGLRMAVPRLPYLGAQAVIGAMVSAAITPAIVVTLGHDWPLFGVVMATTLLGAAALGWMISRSGLIPGATAVYGISPGAGSAMVLLGEAEGADARLVAFMQYSRVLLVAVAAALVARFWAGASGAPAATSLLAPVQWGNLAAVLLLAALGQQVARLLRLQAWALLGPMILLSALHAGGWLAIDLPRWLLAGAYALLGWHIGLGFSRDALRQAGRALPVVAAAALCLMAFCGLLGWVLTRLVHVDALTAYLATSPGGLDSVAIIAASTPRVDLPFVLALQSVRLLFVIGLAPLTTRLVVRHSAHLQRLPKKTGSSTVPMSPEENGDHVPR
ncbi:MAG TPA: AbrB family transcriptional regulator [Steroidobacteraceae bacterium]|nr:AbrB family transcriptional regulator [Steroidobacteraceae bacterium]